MKTNVMWCMDGKVQNLSEDKKTRPFTQNIAPGVNKRDIPEFLRVDPRRYHKGVRKTFF